MRKRGGFPVWLLATAIGVLPRPMARAFCESIGMFMYTVHRRLRKVGLRNLDIAFPEKTRKEKLRILRTLFKGLGRQLAEFALFPRYRKESASEIAIYDGFPIRQCSPRLSVRHPVNACALAGIGRCCAPCDGSVSPETYATVVEQVRLALSTDVRPVAIPELVLRESTSAPR